MSTSTKTGYSDYHDDEDNWHVYPVEDTKDHILNRKHDCFCEPRVWNEDERRIYIHQALDGREKYEH